MSKTKRKIITRTVVRKELLEKERQAFYSQGARDAIYTVLFQHQDLIQLKDLCEEYEKTFKYKHPSRAWHLERKISRDIKEVEPESPGDTGQLKTPSDNTNKPSETTSPVASAPEEVDKVTGGEERA